MFADDKITRRDYEALLSFALRLSNDRDLALDLVQDTLERFVRWFPGDVPARQMRPWLHVVMRRLFIDAVRTRRSRQQTLIDMADPNQLAADEREEVATWESFQLDDVQASLSVLPAGQRRTYEMHALEGMSYGRIADTLNLNIATVGVRIFRARRSLRLALLGGLPLSSLAASKSADQGHRRRSGRGERPAAQRDGRRPVSVTFTSR